MIQMGFMTKGKPTDKVTYEERKKVTEWVHEFAEEQGWDLADVRNRAIMYYAKEYKNGNLDDPKIKEDRRTDAIEDIL